jgi:2,4-dienoyl-CoA reductase-like NADH-dependent reductase (Old Yellow Enzyme family)
MENFSGQEATATGLPSFVEMLRRFNRGDFDLISVGRGMIGDPEWVRKVREGAIAQIRPFTRADVIRTVSR